jgi:hypothetical protein
VGSPPFLRLAALVAAATVCAAAAATAASATPEDDARATAVAFADALTRGDHDRVCSLFSPDALRRLGGMERCRAPETDTEDEVDYVVLETLSRAHVAARLSATKRNGHYVTKRFGAKKLARDMEQLDDELTVKIGRGAAAAKGQLDSTVVLDPRTSARRVVLYAESDDGSIFRLSATSTGRPSYDEVGVGIPESTRPPAEPPALSFAVTIDSVTLDVSGTAYARGTYALSVDDMSIKLGLLLVLVRVDGAYFVDDMYYSTTPIAEPEP